MTKLMIALSIFFMYGYSLHDPKVEYINIDDWKPTIAIQK